MQSLGLDVNVVSEEGQRTEMRDEDDDLLRAAEELGIDLSGVRAADEEIEEPTGAVETPEAAEATDAATDEAGSADDDEDEDDDEVLDFSAGQVTLPGGGLGADLHRGAAHTRDPAGPCTRRRSGEGGRPRWGPAGGGGGSPPNWGSRGRRSLTSEGSESPTRARSAARGSWATLTSMQCATSRR